MVRYYGALGPRSPLRGAVTAATREHANSVELERGYAVTPAAKVSREVRRAANAAGQAWAACLRKIFEVDPVRCGKCSGEMVAVIPRGELRGLLLWRGRGARYEQAARSN
jgi:hypothetical protein